MSDQTEQVDRERALINAMLAKVNGNIDGLIKCLFSSIFLTRIFISPENILENYVMPAGSATTCPEDILEEMIALGFTTAQHVLQSANEYQEILDIESDNVAAIISSMKSLIVADTLKSQTDGALH